MESSASYTIALVAGEASGDTLGASLMHSLKARLPHINFVGIGGQKMQAEGLHSFFEMERLSVMGLVEPLKRLPELISMRQTIIQKFSKNPPDLYIGIDAPDFNLGIANTLKAKGIKTVHYVSPTIWAWRPNRIKKIVNALHHILLIFPFEPDIYKKYNEGHGTQLGFDYIGHPLADELEHNPNKTIARQKLKLSTDLNTQIVAILPGSRYSEISNIAEAFIKTADLLYAHNPERVFVAALLDENKALFFKKCIAKIPHSVPIIIKVNQTRTILQACDAAMVVSGTATLETALTKRPFIVGYKTGFFQYFLAKRLIKVNYIAMPNIIANKALATEYIQENLKPNLMAQELNSLLNAPDGNAALIESFNEMHQLLKQNGSEKAADAVIRLLQKELRGS